MAFGTLAVDNDLPDVKHRFVNRIFFSRLFTFSSLKKVKFETLKIIFYQEDSSSNSDHQEEGSVG